MKVEKIILYDEPKVPEIQLSKLSRYLQENFLTKVEIRKNFFQKLDDKTNHIINAIRIADLKKPFRKQNFNSPQEEFTEQIIYDGFELQQIISKNIPREENKIENLHIIFTDKLVATFAEEDFRYHARALIASNPSIISTSGIVEAPAKPKQYYLDLMTNFSGEEIESIKRKYKDQFVEHNDPRLSTIIEGYVLQSLIYYETGEAFCDQDCCRLYNAHWQRELLSTQVKKKNFCEKHRMIIKNLRNKVRDIEP